MSLGIKVIKKRDYVYTVELKGSLDTETHQQLKAELSEIIDGKTKAVIMDMGSLSYISSAGVGILVWAEKELKRKYATFTMVNLQPQIKKVLDALKVLPMVSIFQDMPEADKYIDQIIKEEIEKQAA